MTGSLCCTAEVDTTLNQQCFNKNKIIFFSFFCLFAISWATSVAGGGSQARGRIRAVATGLHQSHSNAGSRAASATYTTAHSTPDR